MSVPEPRNHAASVKQRLLNLARARGEDFNFLLTTYGLERLMYRLGQSRHRQDFVLKGAMLFRAWAGPSYRPTRDLDLLGRGDAAVPRLERVFREIWHNPIPSDGLELEPGSVSGEEIREAQGYGGVRIRMTARLGNARIPLQVDVGFGDAVTPGAREIILPSLLDAPPAVLFAYPPETVIAEKLEAMASLGMANTRMKDFYDVWIISRRFSFQAQPLAGAIAATFARRGTPLPVDLPVALTSDFSGDDTRCRQWRAFLSRIAQEDAAPGLPDVVESLARFVGPPLAALRTQAGSPLHWPAGGPWIEPV